MAYVYDNKTYRNLQQQVKENMDDIARLQDLKLVGLDVSYIVDTEEDLEEITAEQGMVVAVGTEQPYTLFVYNDSSWVDFGEFPKAGPQGPQGIQGQVGNPGPRGLTGEPGPRGYTGAAGPAGQPGPQGQRGAQGPKGDKGDPGLVDAFAADAESITAVGQAYVDENGYLQVCTSLSPLTFEQGASVKGPKGDTGEQGPQGIQGEQGAQGPTGATGPQGARGPQGEQGIRGPQGEQGIQGPQGPTGATGPEGPQGPKGDTGPQGPTGPKGDTGSPVTITVNGTTYTQSQGNITLPDYPDEVAWGNIQGTLSDQTDLQDALDDKQDTLVSGTNIKTVNNQSLVGSGNIEIVSGVWGNITGTLSDQTDLNAALAAKQDKIDADHKLSASLVYGLSTVATTGDYDDLIDKPSIPTKTSDLTNDSDFTTKTYVDDELADKQDVISDLSTIRSGAALGATALQSVPSEYITDSELATELATKQDVISDLATIRSGAAAGATAVQPAAIADMMTTDTNQLTLSGEKTWLNVYDPLQTGSPTNYTASIKKVNNQDFRFDVKSANNDNSIVKRTEIWGDGLNLYNKNTSQNINKIVQYQMNGIHVSDDYNNTWASFLLPQKTYSQTLACLSDVANCVTINTDQTITGKKTFSGDALISTGNFTVSDSATLGVFNTLEDSYTSTRWPLLDGSDYDYDARYYSNGIVIEDSENEDDDAPYYLAYPAKSGTLAVTSDIPTNYVTTDTAQTISGAKTFSSAVNLGNQTNVIGGAYQSFLNLTNSTNTTYWGRIIASSTALDLSQGSSGGISLSKDTNTGNVHLIPTFNATQNLGSSNYNWNNLYLAGNLSDGTNSIAIADIASKTDVSTAIAGQTKETWTFTLSDGTTTTKTIVLG